MELRNLKNGKEEIVKIKNKKVNKDNAIHNMETRSGRIREYYVTSNNKRKNTETKQLSIIEKKSRTEIKLKTSSAERMRKLRERRRQDPEFNIKKYHEEESKRIAKLRFVQKKKRNEDPYLLDEYRKKERMRKQEQRKIKTNSTLKIRKINAHKGRYQRRRKSSKDKNEIINDLQFKVKVLINQNRRLKRKSPSVTPESPISNETSAHSIDETTPSTSAASVLIGSISPSSKKRARRRLKLDPRKKNSVNSKLRLDKVSIGTGRKSILQTKVEAFLLNDENTVIVPDIKKSKKGIRYRLLSLSDLHQKFLGDEDIECSYSQFSRCVPDNIVKPRPEDWGTCLCIFCLNPELKLESIKRTLGNVSITHNDLINEEKQNDINELYNQVKSSDKQFEYLEWVKEPVKKGKKGKVKGASYNSKKTALSSSSENFEKLFKHDVQILQEHSNRFRSQYRKIRELKNLVVEPTNKSVFLRIDWSENVKLFQTRQEKSEYYCSTSCSVNAAVLYSPDGVIGLGTISDVKSHTAPSVWASLTEILKLVDLTDTETLYIASDSPSSQYRNKNNIFLTKLWAVKNKKDVHWIFTESGHGKGPMDGIGAKIKTTIKDTIAYLPNEVIRTTNELLNHLPLMHNILIGTYTDKDVQTYSSMLPKNLVIVSSFGLSKVHEVVLNKEDNNMIKWKKLSSDDKYTNAKIKVNEQNKVNNPTPICQASTSKITKVIKKR